MTPDLPPPLSGSDFSRLKTICIRALVYILIVGAVMQIVMLDADNANNSRFSEFSYTEGLQTLFLSAIAFLLIYIRRTDSAFPNVALLMLGFILASLAREQDHHLDLHVFDGAWQLVVFLIVVPCLVLVWRNREKFLQEFNDYSHSSAFGLFAAGFLTTYVFSRLYGRTEFWRTLMDASYDRAIKNSAEEVTELMGYMLLFFATVELLLLVRRLRKNRQEKQSLANSN